MRLTEFVPAGSAATFFTLLIAPFAVFAIVRGIFIGEMLGYNLWQWSISYDLEFVKRGLPGAVLNIFGADAIVSPDLVYTISIVILLLFSGQLVYLSYRFLDYEKSLEAMLMILVFIMLPMTLSWYAFDIGRFDYRMPMTPHLVVALIVREDEDNIRPLGPHSK